MGKPFQVNVVQGTGYFQSNSGGLRRCYRLYLLQILLQRAALQILHDKKVRRVRQFYRFGMKHAGSIFTQNRVQLHDIIVLESPNQLCFTYQ